MRTNNEVEGWHNRLNHRSLQGQLDIYQLAPLLHKEADFVIVQASLVSDAKLRRHQRKTYAAIQGRLSEYWAMYAAGDLTTSALLRKCSRVYGPDSQSTSNNSDFALGLYHANSELVHKSGAQDPLVLTVTIRIIA